MRQQLTDLISRCDIFPVPVGLKSGSKGRIKTCFAGVISIIIAAFYLYFLITRIIAIANYQAITSVSSVEKIANKSSMSAQFTTFAFGIDSLTNVQFLNYFSPFIEVYKNNQMTESYTLQICKLSRWTGLSQGQFQAFGLGNLLCPQNYEPFHLDGVRNSLTPDFIKMTIKGCKERPNVDNLTQAYPTVDPQLRYTCDEAGSKMYLLSQTFLIGGMQLFFYIYGVSVATQQITAIKKTINFDVKSFISQKTGVQMSVQWASTKVNTDVSINPWSSIHEQSDAVIDRINSIAFPVDVTNITANPIAIVTFTMNDKLITYTRKVDKLITAFAMTGGFFAFVIPIVAFFMIRYNMYVYDLRVTDKTFRQEQNALKPFGAHTVLGFIKYNVYHFFRRVFRCKVNWKDCKQISKNKRQAAHLMEISHLLKRIQTLQTSMDYSVNRNEAECLVLLQQKTLKEARNARLKASYYSAIIRERSHMTIHDLRRTYDATDLSLEQFYKTKLQNASQNKHLTEKALAILIEDSQANASVKPSQNNLDHTKNQEETKAKIEFKNSKADLQILDNILNALPELQNEAAGIQLSVCYTKIEQRMAKSFYNMKSEARLILEQKIPLLILCRLMTKIKAMRTKRAQEFSKRSQMPDQNPENQKNDEVKEQETENKIEMERVEKNDKQKKKRQKHEIDSDQEDKMNQAEIDENQTNNFKSWIRQNNDNQDHKL